MIVDLYADWQYDFVIGILDDKIKCRCISCYPDVTDDTCSCAWEFWI